MTIFKKSIGLFKSIICSIINGRSVKISLKSYPEVYYSIENHNKIQMLVYNGYKLRIGDSFDFTLNKINHSYYIKNIDRLNDTEYLLQSELVNKCSIYILPVLSTNISRKVPTTINNNIYSVSISALLKSYYLFDQFLLNAYICNDRKHLILKYRFVNEESYLEFDRDIHLHPLFVEKTDICDDIIIFKFRIPEEHHNDIDDFYNGNYSKFSDNLKRKIRSFHGFDTNQEIIKVLYKKEDLRKRIEINLDMTIGDSELDNKPNLKEEIWHSFMEK
jgi:hypothetical protein